MDKWVKNGFEWRYEFSRNSGRKFVIRIAHGEREEWRHAGPRYELIWQYRDRRGYWREQSLGERHATLRDAKAHAAMLGATA